MKMEDLSRFIRGFNNKKVLVIGDIIADHYIWGKVERISPEAPVPIVEVQRESFMLGGAGNVANNILSLKGDVLICGVVGNDDMGGWITRSLEKKGVDTSGIITESGRPTTKKTRVIAHNQHVVRFDNENRGSISEESQAAILNYILTHLKGIGVLVLSDYAKGVITSQMVKSVLEYSLENNIKIVVDPKMKHFDYYAGVTVITPNTSEASAASGITIQDDASLHQAGEILLKQTNTSAILITRGEQGMSLFESNGDVTHIPAVAREVYDVTGAGDTVVSTLALSLAAGASFKESAAIANYAAGIVVGIVGTATVNQGQLLSSMAA